MGCDGALVQFIQEQPYYLRAGPSVFGITKRCLKTKNMGVAFKIRFLALYKWTLLIKAKDRSLILQTCRSKFVIQNRVDNSFICNFQLSHAPDISQIWLKSLKQSRRLYEIWNKLIDLKLVVLTLFHVTFAHLLD